MGRRGSLLAAGLSLAAALLIAPAAAGADIASGPLRASVTADPWHLSITDGSGGFVLNENRGHGSGPTGTLGFRTTLGWFHATRVASGGMQGGSYGAELETTDPTRGIHLRIDPESSASVRRSLGRRRVLPRSALASTRGPRSASSVSASAPTPSTSGAVRSRTMSPTGPTRRATVP